jgi:DNA topoisomerase-1
VTPQPPAPPRPPGITRHRTSRGWSYTAADGTTLADPEFLQRIAGLSLPPAWAHVWINPDPHADLQATGVDARGRTQYRYSLAFRRRHDLDKFAHVLDFAAALPALRRDVDENLTQPGLSHEHVLAASVRLLDRGFFRVGNPAYARDNHTYGLTTLQRRHVTPEPGGRLRFDYTAKEHRHRVVEVNDPAAATTVAALLARTDTSAYRDQLLVYRHPDATATVAWLPLPSSHINAYVHSITHLPATAKAFRTWSGTVLAAAALAGADTTHLTIQPSRNPVLTAYRATAALLGNTPAVAAASYIHPALITAYRKGHTVTPALHAAAHRHSSSKLDEVWLDPELQDAVHQLLTDPNNQDSVGVFR